MAATSQPAEAHQPTTLIVFYSRSGVSKNVATEVAALLGDHNTVVFEIKDTKSREGWYGFTVMIWDALWRSTTTLVPADQAIDLTKFSRIILFGPIWAGSLCVPLRTWIVNNKGALVGKNVVLVSTMTNAGHDKALAELKSTIPESNVYAHIAFIEKTVTSGAFKEEVAKFVRDNLN